MKSLIVFVFIVGLTVNALEDAEQSGQLSHESHDDDRSQEDLHEPKIPVASEHRAKRELSSDSSASSDSLEHPDERSDVARKNQQSSIEQQQSKGQEGRFRRHASNSASHENDFNAPQVDGQNDDRVHNDQFGGQPNEQPRLKRNPDGENSFGQVQPFGQQNGLPGQDQQNQFPFGNQQSGQQFGVPQFGQQNGLNGQFNGQPNGIPGQQNPLQK
ncbi:hypothetical protein M3Y98_01216900 [Aphelenchoides besseyi]|nr:hypothetical protein M3Y98_01216900 [Aphelenchoides besseyi]KAI6193296.1 hypothetical protein M3Y96_01003200 [Aphelenchoides besseyi]